MTETAVQLTHIPTGIMVRCETEKSQKQNRQTALAVLRARLLASEEEAIASDRNATRRKLVGSGMRGDKVRTIRYQDGVVKDHRTGKKIPLRVYLKGELEGLFSS